MVQYWIGNSCRINTADGGRKIEDYMLNNNIFCIGYGTPEEKREQKKGNTTIKQINKFINEAKQGDIINLYANRTNSIIASGVYKGNSLHKTTNYDGKIPYWDKKEIYTCIEIENWIKLLKPITIKPKRFTLYKYTEN